MKSIYQILSLLLTILAFQVCKMPAQRPQAGWHLLKKTTIGGDGFWDYLTVDTGARQLYIAHGSQVVVLNIDTYQQVGAISGQGVHGVTLVPALHRGFVTNGGNNTVTIFDTKTFEKTGEIEVGKNPDAALYDAFSNRLFVFNADSDDATVIDPVANKAVGTVALGGAPEAAVTDGQGTIFVNLEDKSEIAAFDAKALNVLRRISLSRGEEPTGLAIDAVHHLLFSVCNNKMMLILNIQKGKVIGQIPIGERVDGVVFDATRQVAISSNGEGTLTVVREVSPTEFKVVQTVQTEAGARTIGLDAKTHHVFTTTAQFGENQAPTADNPNPRRKTVSGTFSVLEYGE
ncbi:MAG TPA: YncE family protein [Saprospiraceae bacterium]|nr:YncE family protein [Saprospiraceae bacterium]